MGALDRCFAWSFSFLKRSLVELYYGGEWLSFRDSATLLLKGLRLLQYRGYFVANLSGRHTWFG